MAATSIGPMTSTVAELNALDGITASVTDLNLIDGITNGTVTASKALIVDANKDLGDLRNLDCTNLDAGLSGTAGSVDIFPTTASKGKLAITCTDQTGNTTVSLVAGAMAAARTITLRDPGAAASLLTTTDATAAATAATAAEITGAADLSAQQMSAGAGFAGASTLYKSSAVKHGAVIKTTILIDLTDSISYATDLDIIGATAAAAHIGQFTAALNGTFLGGRITCLEVPATGADDIDLYYATEGTGQSDGAVTDLTETALVTKGGAWAAGDVSYFAADVPANAYLYLCSGEAVGGTYTAGRFMIEMFGY